MGYAKVIKYGRNIEIYQYENESVPPTRKSRQLSSARRSQSVALRRENEVEQKKLLEGKRKSSGRRAQVAFRRLVSANLGEFEKPIFVSLTYATHTEDIGQGRKDFNSFARALKNTYGKHVRYIAVSEFQKSGRLHLHALVWGLPPGVVKSERSTRMVASLWKQGFVDLIQTDGHEKIAGYMAKYMKKAFKDPRLFGYKAYIASRNCKRPIVEKRAIVIATVYEHDLSTVEPLQDIKYLTQWLGECRHRLYEIKYDNEQN